MWLNLVSARCNQTSAKKEEEMDLDEKLLDYLFKESQRSIRKAKLNLAAAEMHISISRKLPKKQKSCNFFSIF